MPRRAGAGGIKKTVKKLQKSVAKLKVNREIKEYYQAVSAMSPAAGGGSGFQATYQLNDIAEGLEYNQRIGRKIVPQALELNFLLQGSLAGAAAAPQATLCRILLIQDLGYNGTALGATKLLQNSSVTPGEIKTAMSPINTDYIRSKNVPDGRVHVLFDKTTWVHPCFSFYASECTKHYKIRIPSKKLKEMYYNGAGSGTAVGGAIFLYICLGQDTAAANNAQFGFISKLTYYDD